MAQVRAARTLPSCVQCDYIPPMVSRRSVVTLLGALGCAPGILATTTERAGSTVNSLRIRTLTAGVDVPRAGEWAPIETALEFLSRAKSTFEQAGYEVQTTRIATSPLIAGRTADERERALTDLQRLDRLARDGGAIVSIGPVQLANRADPSLADWTTELVRTTRGISFSIEIAAEDKVHDKAAASAAETMQALAKALPDGMANFRFAAAANIPAGTPFFPVAWHTGADSLAIGLEAAGLVAEAFGDARNASAAGEQLRAHFNSRLEPIQALAADIAARAERTYLGIDASPAPGLDRSIGAAIEALTGAPFGAAGTLEACAVVTAAIKALSVRTCGYSGLMLPVLEDPVLAQRASEGRYTVRDLLLYSSVCGTGLDVVPIPGDTPAEVITRLLRDVAALSCRLHKPLSARLFIVPGRKAGETATFEDPWLTDSTVMRVD